MRTARPWTGGATARNAPVWIAMVAIVAVSWLYLVRMDGNMAAQVSNTAAHAAMGMSGSGGNNLAMVFAMWAVMMMAMMLPAITPSALVFSTLSARRDPAHCRRATAMYVSGYAACWIAFAAPAAVLQWTQTNALLLDPMLRSTSTLLSSAILVAAGVYQFTPLKNACLSKCRTPLGFFMAKWRDGARGALLLGLQHGGYCVGCCWALMAVMFVVGAMNLAAMGLIVLLVLGEKVVPSGWRFDRAVGAMLVASGLWIAASAWAVS